MRPLHEELAFQALEKALEVRATNGFDDESPICIYDLCAKMKISVRFAALPSMEGTYICGMRPQILLSSLRPLGRRAFTCAHELGHHVFGHGSSINELQEQEENNAPFQPNEFLANAFSGFLLMPTIGIRNAFRMRGWSVKTSSAEQAFTIACHFGVGYETLLKHLGYGVKEISPSRVKSLGKIKLPMIRYSVLGRVLDRHLLIADKSYSRPTLDAEVGMFILTPPDTESDGSSLALVERLSVGNLFEAIKPGMVRVHGCEGTWATIVRISRSQYVGLAQHRHIEEVD